MDLNVHKIRSDVCERRPRKRLKHNQINPSPYFPYTFRGLLLSYSLGLSLQYSGVRSKFWECQFVSKLLEIEMTWDVLNTFQLFNRCHRHGQILYSYATPGKSTKFNVSLFLSHSRKILYSLIFGPVHLIKTCFSNAICYCCFDIAKGLIHPFPVKLGIGEASFRLDRSTRSSVFYQICIQF